MKVAQFSEFGQPEEVISCVDADDPGDPGSGEVVIQMDAFPINPADLLTLRGQYPSRCTFPSTLGSEGVGHIIAVGPGISDLKVGDAVLPLGRDNWVQLKKEKASAVVKLPSMDLMQAAMLKVNPATAWFMLKDHVDLSEDDWVIQNAANSGVGRNLIKLAERRGIKTINIVRREDLVPLLKEQCGASAVLLDGPDLVESVAHLVGDHWPKLGLDAVGGEATRVLSKCLRRGGTVVNYGLLSGKSCVIDPNELIFQRVTLTGFWLASVLTGTPVQDLREIYFKLGSLVENGTLVVPVEETYPIDRIRDAVQHAGRTGRSGKIIVLPTG